MEKGATKNYWIGGLIMLGLFFGFLSGWSFFTAGRGASLVVDPDYYAHGLKYNDSRQAQEAAAATGWHAAVAIMGRKLTVHLADADNNPVTGCRGYVSMLKAKPDRRLPARFALDEPSPGVYSAMLPSDIEGAVSAEFALEKEKKLLKRKILLSIKSGS